MAPMPDDLKLFAYFDLNNPLVAWEVAIGRVNSAPDRGPKGFPTSLRMYGLLLQYSKAGFTPELGTELRLEGLRRKEFPHRMSRIVGQFFFKSYEDAVAALQRWPSKSRIPLRWISEVKFSADSWSEHDSEWYTTFAESEDKDDSWLREYWSGNIYGVRALTEVIATGRGTILNDDLRKEAYCALMRKWPKASPLLSAASCVFTYSGMKDAGLALATLRYWESTMFGEVFMKMEEIASPAGVEAMMKARADGHWAPFIPHPKHPDILSSTIDLGEITFKLEDPEIIRIFGANPTAKVL